MTPCFRFFDGIKVIQLTSKAVLPEIVGFYMDAEHARQGSKTSVSNAQGVCPGGSAWRQAGDEAEPARSLRRKVHGRKANRSSLVVRRLKDVRRQGTKPLTEQLADRIAGPAGSLGTTVDTEQVRSF